MDLYDAFDVGMKTINWLTKYPKFLKQTPYFYHGCIIRYGFWLLILKLFELINV